MIVHQAYRFALDPSPRAERALASHVSARRVAFDWGLVLVKERLDARRQGEDVGVPWTLPALRREWNQAKETVAPWWWEHSKEAYSCGPAGAEALKNWHAGGKDRRKEGRMGFPRFKNFEKKGRCQESVGFTTGEIRVEGKSHVFLPRIGRVRMHEAATALLSQIEAGKAKILRATVSRAGGRWHASFTSCEAARDFGQPKPPEAVMGADAGLRHLTVLSTGEKVPNPKPPKAALRKIARLNRELARRKPGSRNREETRRRLSRTHASAANIRQDAWHELTTRLARTYGTVVVERLHVAGMMRNQRLARVVPNEAGTLLPHGGRCLRLITGGCRK
jgi:putative transposase